MERQGERRSEDEREEDKNKLNNDRRRMKARGNVSPFLALTLPFVAKHTRSSPPGRWNALKTSPLAVRCGHLAHPTPPPARAHIQLLDIAHRTHQSRQADSSELTWDRRLAPNLTTTTTSTFQRTTADYLCPLDAPRKGWCCSHTRLRPGRARCVARGRPGAR